MPITLGNLLKTRMVADKTAELAMQLSTHAMRELSDEEVSAVTGGVGATTLLVVA